MENVRRVASSFMGSDADFQYTLCSAEARSDTTNPENRWERERERDFVILFLFFLFILVSKYPI